MMSATTVSAGAASSGYYKAEGYYIAGSDEDKASAQWFGTQAQALGLTGRVDDELFTKLLDGQTYVKGEEGLVPGRQMGRLVDGERQHRAGIDLTFSAPKSVSIAALVYQDERVIEAHDKAVKSAMEYVETNLVQTRRVQDGQTITETGGKIIAGLFRHDTSRAMDPQLHTHAVIVNQIENAQGQVTAVHNDLIFKAQKLGSELYRDTLATELKELGYTVERSGKDRLISIQEVPKELESQFSKRRQEIEEALAKRQMPESPKTAELAALATRATKNNGIDRAEIKEAWQKEAAAIGVDQNQIRDTLKTVTDRCKSHVPGVMRDDSKAELALNVLNQGVASISERTSVYTKTDLLSAAASFKPDNINTTDLLKAYNAAVEAGSIFNVKADQKVASADLITDKHSLLTEHKIIASLSGAITAANMPKAGRGRSFDAELRHNMARTSMSEGQQEAVLMAMTGKSRFVGVQGYAGTGKTYMMQYLANAAEKAGYTIEGVAPSHKAVSQLAEVIPASETLQARLLRNGASRDLPDGRKTILVVDESSMVSNSQMLELMDQAAKAKIARVVFVGDVKQLDAVSAGTPFALLQNAGMPTANMTDIVRQRDDSLLAAVHHSVAGEIQSAFKKLAGNIVTNHDYAKSAAEQYLALGQKERQSAAILTPSNKVREAINEHVREGLKLEGKLSLNDVALPTLSPLHLTKAEAAEPRSYRTGDILVSHQALAGQNVKKDTPYLVSLTPDNKLTLTEQNTGHEIPFDPNAGAKTLGAIALFEAKETPFAVGDSVQFVLKDKSENIQNGHQGTIVAINEQSTTVELANGNVRTLPNDSLAVMGMDHEYSQTGHGLQGATVDQIIVAIGANEHLANQKSFYVAISRARDEATLVTDDPARLSERIQAQTGEKIIALDAFTRANEEKQEADKDLDQEHTKREGPGDEKKVATQEADRTSQLSEMDRMVIEELRELAVAQLEQKEMGEMQR